MSKKRRSALLMIAGIKLSKNHLILFRHTAADWASAPMGFIPAHPSEGGSRHISVCEERLIQSIGHPSALKKQLIVPDVPARCAAYLKLIADICE